MTKIKYNLLMRLMHWISGVGFLFTLFLGILLHNTNWLKSSTYLNTPLHKSFGLLIFSLVIIRILVRFSSELPQNPEINSKFATTERFIAKLTYCSLYFFMIEIPLVGFLMSNVSGRAVSFFGLFIVSPILSVNKDIAKTLYTIHQWSGYLALCFVGLHLLGTMKHLIFDKVNLLKRMV